MYFQVDSVDTKFKELQSKGVQFVNQPGSYFWGYGAELRDPDGYQILLWDRRSMRAKGKSQHNPTPPKKKMHTRLERSAR